MNGLPPRLTKLVPHVRISQQFAKHFCQMCRVVWPNQSSTARAIEDFGERAVVGHDNRYAAGQGFQNEAAFPPRSATSW